MSTLKLIIYKIKKSLFLKYLYTYKLPYYTINLGYVNSMYETYLWSMEKLSVILNNEIYNDRIDNIKNPSYHKILGSYQTELDKTKEKIQELNKKYSHEIRLCSYFYKHGYITDKNKKKAEIALAKYKDNVFKYEKDFKNYDYKLENKKYKILTRKKEMEGDFNESLD